jgi:hypothetical protein
LEELASIFTDVAVAKHRVPRDQQVRTGANYVTDGC